MYTNEQYENTEEYLQYERYNRKQNNKNADFYDLMRLDG